MQFGESRPRPRPPCGSRTVGRLGTSVILSVMAILIGSCVLVDESTTEPAVHAGVSRLETSHGAASGFDLEIEHTVVCGSTTVQYVTFNDETGGRIKGVLMIPADDRRLPALVRTTSGDNATLNQALGITHMGKAVLLIQPVDNSLESGVRADLQRGAALLATQQAINPNRIVIDYATQTT